MSRSTPAQMASVSEKRQETRGKSAPSIDLRAKTEAAHTRRIKAAREAKDTKKEVSFLELNRRKRETRSLKKSAIRDTVDSSKKEAHQPTSASPIVCDIVLLLYYYVYLYES